MGTGRCYNKGYGRGSILEGPGNITKQLCQKLACLGKLLKTNYGLFSQIQNHSISSKCRSRSSPSTRKDAVLSFNFIREIPPEVRGLTSKESVVLYR